MESHRISFGPDRYTRGPLPPAGTNVLICRECGAVVEPTHEQVHDLWHLALARALGL